MTPLYAMLNRWRLMPFSWGGFDGGTDCVLALADWCEICGWGDPMADVRMTYDSPASCQRETGFMRDPLGITSRCFEGVGMERVSEPQEGDIAILRLGPTSHVGAVRARYRAADRANPEAERFYSVWVSKADPGVIFHEPGHEVLRIWGMNYAP